MTIKLKVCGMRNAANIGELVKARPDYIGFIFYKKSPRYAGDELKPESAGLVPENIKKIGVFVNEDVQTVIETARKYGLEGVQLHGNESPEECRQVAAAGFLAIKALQIEPGFDFNLAKEYERDVDYFLFDTKSSGFGGSGVAFDWNILEQYDLDVPFFLSGGVEESMADEINRLTHSRLYGIDINSRFETSPGIKDIRKIRAFKEKLR